MSFALPALGAASGAALIGASVVTILTRNAAYATAAALFSAAVSGIATINRLVPRQ